MIWESTSTVYWMTMKFKRPNPRNGNKSFIIKLVRFTEVLDGMQLAWLVDVYKINSMINQILQKYNNHFTFSKLILIM